MREKDLRLIVTVSLLLIAVECSPLDYELSYTERHHKETIPKKPTGYARCSCERETPLQNYTSGYIYKTLHNKRMCSEVLTPTICSFFEGCNYCIGTIEKCEPVQGGYQCMNATVLFQQLDRNTTSVNNTVMFETYYNFDVEKNMNVPSVKRFMEKESELKMSKSPEIRIHQETNKKIQKVLAPILQRNFQKKTKMFKLKRYHNKENRWSLEMYNETRKKTPKINQRSASVYKGKNEEVPMSNSGDYLNYGEEFQLEKRRALEDREDKVKNFEEGTEEHRLALEMHNHKMGKTPKLNKPETSIIKGKNKELPMDIFVDVNNPNDGEIVKPGKRSALADRTEEHGLAVELHIHKQGETPKISKSETSVVKGKNKGIPMNNPNDGEVSKPGKRSKRSALEDGVKGFEGAAEQIFEQKDSFEENQEGAANFEEETEDPLNKIHEVHCNYPTTGRTFATDVIRFQTYDLITQKCKYGYAFEEGIARSMRCDHDKNELKPKYDIWTEECKPFLNCSVEFIRGGYARCRSGLWFRPPTCEVRCDFYIDGDNVVEYHTCDVHKGWIPDLPSCAIPGSHSGLILPPIPMLHELN